MCWIAHMHTHTYTHKLACHVNPLRWLRQSGWVRLCCDNKEPRNIRPDNNHSGHPAHSTRWTPPPYFSGLYPDTEAYAFYPQAFLISFFCPQYCFFHRQPWERDTPCKQIRMLSAEENCVPRALGNGEVRYPWLSGKTGFLKEVRAELGFESE